MQMTFGVPWVTASSCASKSVSQPEPGLTIPGPPDTDTVFSESCMSLASLAVGHFNILINTVFLRDAFKLFLWNKAHYQ